MNNRQLTIILLLVFVGTGAFWDSEAVRRVRAGIRHFTSGEFEKAAEAFAAADSELPDNNIVRFDRAATLTAMGKPEDATEFYQQAALARSAPLSAAAQYNMGNIAADKAQQILGDDPVNVDPSKREEVVSGLLSAVGHYRDCLRVEAGHEDARHNLELIRLFIKHIQAEWEKRDREQAREELGLLEFLAMIEQKQILLRKVAKPLTEEQDSPQRRQAIRETADSQRQLQEEIEPLKQKIEAELQASAGQQSSPDDEQTQQVRTLLNQLADDASAAMLLAADQLQSADISAARDTQQDTLAQLNQIYMVLVPFNQLLQRAIQTQEGLVSQSEASLPETDQNDEDTQGGPASSPQITFDFDQNTWQQTRVTDWSRLLSLKAEAEIPQVQEQLAAAKASAEATESALPPADDDTDEQTTPDDSEAATTEVPPDPTQQLQAQLEARQKAIELAPEVEQHSLTAQQELQQEHVAEALPDQQEALKLLQEIAEPLKQDQEKDQNQQDDENEQQGQDQQQDQQQNQESDEQKSDQQEQQSNEDRQQQDKKQAQQQAESVLRRAREREREHREQQKELRRILGGLVPVDKDW